MLMQGELLTFLNDSINKGITRRNTGFLVGTSKLYRNKIKTLFTVHEAEEAMGNMVKGEPP